MALIIRSCGCAGNKSLARVVEGAEIGSLLGPAGAVAGGVLGVGVGAYISLDIGHLVFAESNNERGLPPDGVSPPVEGECEVGPASRPSEQAKGGKSLWDPDGGEWRYFPENKWHNPHWDHNPHDAPNSPWVNVPIDGLPPVKGK